MQTFNLSAYGVTFGTGQSEATQRANTAGIRAAVVAANAATASDTAEVVIDQNDAIEFFLDPADDTLSVDGGGTCVAIAVVRPTVNRFTMRGVGVASELVMLPDAPSFDYYLFYLDALLGRRDITLSDFKATGPENYGSGDILLYPEKYGFKHNASLTPNAYAQASVVFDGVVASGNWTGAFNSNSGDVSIVMTDTTMIGTLVACNIFNQAGCAKSVTITGGHYETTYTATDNGDSLYIHPNIETHVSGAHLICLTRFRVYINGTPTSPVPATCIIENCTTDSDSVGYFVQSNKLCTTIVRNNAVTVNLEGGLMVACLGDALIHDNALNNGTIGAGDFSVEIYDNVYAIGNSTTTGDFITGSNVYAHDNACTSTTPGMAFIGLTAGSTPGSVCLLEDNECSGSWNRGLIACFNTDGRVIARRNAMSGTVRGVYGIDIGGSPTTNEIVLENNDFSTAIIQLYDYQADHVVSGFGNRVRAIGPFDFNTNPTQQDLVNRSATGPDVASATDVSLDGSYNRVTLTGTTSIENFYIGNNADQNNGFLGRYTFVFESAVSLLASGNVSPILPGPRTPGTFATFIWNQGTLLWVETRPEGIDPRILYSDGRIGRAMSLPEFFDDVLIPKLNELCGVFGGVDEIDPEILHPDGEIGRATSAADFYDLVILTINSLIDQGPPVDQIDPRILYSDADQGHAESVLPFFDLVIATVNEIIGAT